MKSLFRNLVLTTGTHKHRKEMRKCCLHMKTQAHKATESVLSYWNSPLLFTWWFLWMYHQSLLSSLFSHMFLNHHPLYLHYHHTSHCLRHMKLAIIPKLKTYYSWFVATDKSWVVVLNQFWVVVLDKSWFYYWIIHDLLC